jgi:hypothetical protein
MQTSLPVLAQSVIELHGTVTDETGAVILGATVILEGENKKYISTTADLGQYRFLGIKPGAYTLTVQAEGFAKFTKSLNLAANHVAPVNVVLRIAINERAEVRSDAPVVSTEPDKNLSGVTLSGKDLEALPDDPDDLLSTLKQMAGASGDANVYVDGFQEGGRLPPKQAIMIIRINSNPFAAEYSESGFARIEIITKPGTSTFHGNLRLNFNDESLNARNSFAPYRAPLQIRNYSVLLYGPIIRNRWDFFLDFERREQDENAVVNASVLDATLEPKTLAQTVLTPSRLTNFSLRTDFLATKNNTLGAWYRQTNNVSRNNGLEGGFDLPERAFDRKSTHSSISKLTTFSLWH